MGLAGEGEHDDAGDGQDEDAQEDLDQPLVKSEDGIIDFQSI